MAKFAFSMMKIFIFSLIMLAVAKIAPYDDLVNNFVSHNVSYDDANFIGKALFGEPDPEPYESVIFYIEILLAVLITVPIFSALISSFIAIRRKVKLTDALKEWGVSILRRFVKLFAFTFLFLTLLRGLPYQLVFPDGKDYSSAIIISLVSFHLIITIFCYWFITHRIIKGKGSC